MMSLDNQEILTEFAVEAQEHLEHIEAQLLEIESGGEQVDDDLINQVFRAVHSVKGASGFLGLTTIGELAHSMENVLNQIRSHTLQPSSESTDILLRGADMLRKLIADVTHANEVDVTPFVTELKGITGVTMQAEAKVEVSTSQQVSLQVSQEDLEKQRSLGHYIYAVDLDLIADVHDKGKTPLQLVQEITAFGEVMYAHLADALTGGLEGSLPDTMHFAAVIATILDDPSLLASALNIRESQVQTIDRASDDAQPVESLESAAVSPTPTGPTKTDECQNPSLSSKTVPTSGPAVPSQPERNSDTSPTGPRSIADSNIRVSVGLLDHLMNLAGELVLARNQLIQLVSDKQDNSLTSISTSIDHITSELQEAIMQTRMQPIATVFNKFPRIVRDLSTKLDKECELDLRGKEVELDKSIIEAIGDPLTHLIRNAVDHGVETPAVRKAAGKGPKGTILLQAFHQAGKVNISISDDGGGIDTEKLRKAAIEKNVLPADQIKEMADRDVVRLIFHPGFSTAKQVTDVSGRGVGMDVVKTNIEKLGGSVDVESTLGTGTTISIKLPLTLAIIPALVVRCGQERLAVPQVSIHELVRIKPSEVATRIERIKNAEVFRLRGALLPLVRLSKVLGTESRYLDPVSGDLKVDRRVDLSDAPSTPQPEHPTEIDQTNDGDQADNQSGIDRRRDTSAGALTIAVVESGQLKYGLIVDAVHDSEEIVVKPLGKHMTNNACLAGATILGDGKVAMILDIAGIADHCKLEVTDAANDAGLAETNAEEETQTVLLFKNHASEQFAIPMGMISRLESIRQDQIDSVGGHELLQYRNSTLPLLSLENLIKAKPRPTEGKLHVIVSRVGRQELGLIAPTLVDIRQISASVDTITFREPGVAGSIVVDEQTTRLVNLVELVQTAHPEWNQTGETASHLEPVVQPCILLAEDSGFFRSQLKSTLESEGYEVLDCEDGAVAWDVLHRERERIGLVVTDIEMPRMNGFELTENIKSDPALTSIPVIAVTSLASDADIARGKACGVDDYQVKLDRDELISAVTRLISTPTVSTTAAAASRASAGGAS